MGKAVGRIALACVAATLGALTFAGAASAATLHDTTRAAASTQQYVLDFTETTFGRTPIVFGDHFVGQGTLSNLDGTQAGTAVDTCDVVGGSPTDPLALCIVSLQLPNGTISLNASLPIDLNPLAYPYTSAGSVTGGTGDYDGVSGDANVTATAPAVYTVTLNLA